MSCILISCEKKPYSLGPDTYVWEPGFKVVGYIESIGFKDIDRLELNKLTHLNLAFANPDQEGNLVFRKNINI